MKLLLQLEELLMFIASGYYFVQMGNNLLLFFILLLIPDIGMIGHMFNPKLGSYTYNITHHKGIAIALFLIGYIYKIDILMNTGVIIFAHSSMDRLLGFGLKYADHFKHTHLGHIGGKKKKH